MGATPGPVTAWESLFRAQVAILRDIGAAFPHDEVSFTEYDVLFNLARLPDRRARLKDLTRQLLLTQPSVSRLVARLAARGLLATDTPPDDGRGTIVALTDDGMAVYRRVGVAHARAIRNRFGDILDEDELATLARLCDRLRLGTPEP